MAEGTGNHGIGRGFECEDDPFANFSYNPPKPTGHLKTFARRNRYRSMAGLSPSRDRLGSLHGSNSSLSTLVGSNQNLYDPNKVMSMHEDAKSRRISSEVMKHRLYESVITSPRRRRFSVRCDYYGQYPMDSSQSQGYARMVQSLPVTPAHSENVTPSHSPKSKKKFHYGFMSQSVTPASATPEEEEMELGEDDGCRGLASIFKPQPRFVAASRNTADENEMAGGDNGMAMEDTWLSPGSAGFKHPGSIGLPPKRIKRENSPVSGKDLNALAPTSF